MKESADSVVFLQVAKGRYQRPLTSRDFICNEKEKRHKRNIMFIPFFFHLRCVSSEAGPH